MPDEAVATDTEEVTGDAPTAPEEQGGAAAKSADEKRDAPAVHIKDPAIVSAKRAIGEYQAREYVAECRRASSDDETVVMIGAGGLSEGVMAEIDKALDDHELIKVKLVADDRDARRALGERISQEQDAALVQAVGNIILLFRRSRIENKRRIALP